VTVAFRELGRRDPLKDFSPEHGNAYLWPFATRPEVGAWAIVDGFKGESTVIVGAIGMPSQAQGLELKPLLRLVTAADEAAASGPAHAWLDLARHAANLPLTRSLPERLPTGFDEVPPSEGTATAKAADRHGHIWWKAANLSLDLGRGDEEAEAFKTIARHWYGQRDQLTKQADQRRMKRAIASIDLDKAVRDVRNRSRADIESMTFAGQPLWDWLDHVKALEKAGDPDQALKLVEALIVAAEQEATISGREPGPAYTERAAMIHRKRREYDAEIEVIERWMNACPPEKRGPGATQTKLADRLVRARELARL